jgi:hypothetical protein
MALPTYDPAKHDISLDGYGFIVAPGDGTSPASLAKTDSEPATSRAAIGDGGSENFTLSSYFFQTDVEGGVGQTTLASADRGMTAKAETRFQGHIFPTKKVLTTGSTGGAASGYFREGSTLYGVLATTVENISSGASTASALPVRTGQRPRTSAALSTFWTTASLTLLRKASGGAISDITANLPSGVTPYLFDLYTRFAWVVGRRTLPGASSIRQSSHGQLGIAAEKTISLDSPPLAINTLVLVIAREHDDAPLTVEIVNDGWISRVNNNYLDTSPNVDHQTLVWTREQPQSSDRNIRLEITGAASTNSYYYLAEIQGLDPDASFVDVAVSEYNSGVAIASRPAGTVLDDTGFVLLVTQLSTDTSTLTAPTNYTEVEDLDVGTFRFGVAYRADTTDTDTASYTPSSTANDQVIVMLKLRSNVLTSDLDQTVFVYSANDGATWEEAFNGDSAGMPLPITSLAAMGSLWLTTEYGLYEFRSEDISLDSGESRVLNAVRGPMDEFHYPHGTSYIGTALANFDGSLYYNLGATLRRFPPGGRAEQIWPPRGWSIGGGNVISVVSGEGGIYFGTDDGFLWNYDGRGFHQIAEATADQLSVLHWHAGKLYLKGDPAPYFEYGYPSMRPDVYASAPTTYDVGYFITSIITFEKVGDLKIARRFETQAEFSDGVNATQSGTLTLQYCIIDEGFHPDVFAPDDETADWVTVGTHSVIDGNVKNYTLATPIEFKRLLLRIILTPGTVGIPICEGFGVDGEALMLHRSRFPMNLSISTDTVDRSGGRPYPTEDAVAEALDQLRRWRNPEHASYDPVVTLIYRETGGATTSHTCILEKLDHYMETHQGADGQFSSTMVQCVFREIP